MTTRTNDAPKKRGRPRSSTHQAPPALVKSMQLDGMSYDEIAETLSISKRTVGNLLKLAKDQTVGTVSDRLDRFCQAIKSGDARALGLLDQFEPGDPDKITLDRTGDRPLVFSGRWLREGSTRLIGTTENKPHPDFWTIRIFQVCEPDKFNGARYAVAIEYSTTIKKTPSIQQTVELTSDPSEVMTRYNPLAVLRGFPKAPEYAQRQAYLESSSKLQYGQLVSQMLRDPL